MSSTGFSVYAEQANLASVIVQGAGILSRIEAATSATRARFINEARLAFVVTERTVAGPERSAWSIDEAARRMLVAELACELNLPEGTVQQLILDSQVLVEDLPATLDTLSMGEISWRHAHIVADHASSLPATVRAEFEDRVLPFALTHTATRFNTYARKQRERMHPESIEERHEDAVDKRSVSIAPGADGMAWVTAHLPAESAHAIFTRLTDAAEQARRQGDTRTVEQLRADAFAGALLGAEVSTYSASEVLGAPNLCTILATIRPNVQIMVPILALIEDSTEPATLEGYGPISIDTASLLAANAPNFMRLLTHPETGAVLSVGREKYQVPTEMRRWLQVRDGTCRFPGCGRAAKRCDVDHINEWQDGGDTAHNNLAHLCRKHHRLKSLTDWNVENVGNGQLKWTSPLGAIYLTEPEELGSTG